MSEAWPGGSLAMGPSVIRSMQACESGALSEGCTAKSGPKSPETCLNRRRTSAIVGEDQQLHSFKSHALAVLSLSRRCWGSTLNLAASTCIRRGTDAGWDSGHPVRGGEASAIVWQLRCSAQVPTVHRSVAAPSARAHSHSVHSPSWQGRHAAAAYRRASAAVASTRGSSTRSNSSSSSSSSSSSGSSMDPNGGPSQDSVIGGEARKPDLNDVFSLRQPKDAGAGFSSGAKSMAKASRRPLSWALSGRYLAVAAAAGAAGRSAHRGGGRDVQ
eukprot:194960-Chlamydomonas_euryale.AAC.3